MNKSRLCICLSLFIFASVNVQSQKLSVMSYNIHHGADRNENSTLDSIGYFIREMNPDIVGLQEVDSVCERSGKTDQMRRLADITGMHYSFLRHFPYQGGAYGVGILSQHPIMKVESKRLKLLKRGPNGESVTMLFAVIAIKKHKKILFATAHFSAFDQATRNSQVSETLKYLSSNDLPVIFTGDLNATPDAPEIQWIQQHLQDTDKSGVYTFPEHGPVKKIDYVLVSRNRLKRVENVSVPRVHYSDHLPLITNLVLK